MVEQTNSTELENKEPKKLYRSRINRFIGGVCGGIAEYFNIDPTIVRIVAVLSIFLGGAGFILYLASLIIIPENPHFSPTSQAQPKYSGNSTILWGILLIIVSLIFLAREFDWWDFHWHFFWPPFYNWRIVFPVILILGGILYIVHVVRKENGSKQPSEPREHQFTLGNQPLYRKPEKKMIAGVCAGIAQSLNIDVALVRIGWIALTLLNIPIGFILYLVLVIVLPVANEPTGAKNVVPPRSAASTPSEQEVNPKPEEK